MKTTLYTVLCVAIRLGAVLMAVGLLERLPVFLWESPAGGFALDAVLLAVFGLLVAGALWLWPGILAGWAIGRRGHELLEIQLDADGLMRVALTVTGAMLGVSGLAGCLGHGLTMLLLRSRLADAATGQLPVSGWHWVIYYLVQAAGGMALMLGARGLMTLLQRMRGRPPHASAETDDGIGPHG
ncbi:hypothetical protein [Rhodanobacter sp. DHB23]|uniref:hypothetical protein n=1 Tax=Rhodanobacter sp. DHB23 TaxID=2775923 RepID=UPI00177D9F58|nr:hypothetical protein [Rhodanobacter sp. DHB23]MBD8873309.1 hypothetical protein [Rhodanobacter sp. DHB23]